MTKNKTTKRALLSSVLALFLCFTMLLGTTYAWFTDSVSSKGNVIQTGNLKLGFQWAERVDDLADADWTTVDGSPIFTYVNWEPGFAAVKHFKVSNEGSLALNYQMRLVANGVVSDLANVIDVYVFNDVTITSADLKAATPVGTLLEVMGTEKNISRSVAGSLEAGDPADIYTVAFKMRESAGDEYQNMDLGSTFTVQLYATQMSAEEDSFGPEYDIIVPSPELPAALVTPLDNLNITYTTDFPNGTPVANPLPLNAGYQFLPTEYGKDLENENNPAFPNEAGMSAYKHWHADYVVTADSDIALNTIALAGYYGAFCKDYNNDNWVAIMDDSTDVLTAGSEVALLDVLGNFCVTYQDICDWGNDGKGFQCGIIARDATALAGTTITVELRLYENLNNEWSDSSHDCDGVNYDGYYETVGTFTYTFPHTAEYVAEQLAAGSDITLLNDVVFDKNTTITIPNGVESTLDLNGYTISTTANKSGNQELFLVKGDLTVKNGSIEMVAENNQGWGSMATIFDVTAGGALTLEGVNASISGTDMSFIAHLNNWGEASISVNNCEFYAPYVAVRAFNSGYDMNNVTIKNTNVTGGGRLFWVHNYTSEGANDSTLNLDIYGNNNTSEHATPIRFGFSNSVYYDLDGNAI